MSPKYTKQHLLFITHLVIKQTGPGHLGRSQALRIGTSKPPHPSTNLE